MTFLCILFTSPLYFLLRKKWGGFIVNSMFYGMALICIITFAFIFIAPLFWAIAFFHALYVYRRERLNTVVHEHAELLATKMAEKLRENPPPQTPATKA